MCFPNPHVAGVTQAGEVLMRTTKVDVLIINQIDGSQTGGFTGYETDKPTYVETIAPTYLRSHFYHTFCAEAANCMQLAASLRAAGLTVKVLDGMLLNLPMEGIREVMKEYEASVYAFSLFHSSYKAVKELIYDLKVRHSDAVVVTGGNYATLVYGEILAKNPDIDYVLVGEADLSFPALCYALKDGRNLDSVPGLAYRVPGTTQGDFTIKLTTPKVPNIDEVEPLARDYAPQVLERQFSFSMISSRGCGLGTCTFCYLPEYQRVSLIPKWRGKSPDKIIDEMEYLRDTYGVNHITFVDEDFIGPRKEGIERLIKFSERLIERKTNMTWYANALVLSVLHLVRGGHIELLAKSGLRFLFVGIESGSDHILRRFKKGFTLPMLKEVVSVLDQYGIRINPGLITFLPESSPSEVKANIDMVKLIKYYDVFVFTRRLVRLPGTEEGCGCAATDTEKVVETTWALPDEEFEKLMAIDVDIDLTQYFEQVKTQYLYAGLAYFRDGLFEYYHHLMRDLDKFSDSQRDFLINAHFGFFYDLYEAVTNGLITDIESARFFAKNRLLKIDTSTTVSTTMGSKMPSVIG